MDAEGYRAESRERWEAVAAGWVAERDAFQRDTAPVSEWLLDAAQLRPGMTVLEVAAGPGELGLEAARRVAPDGRAIVTDGAEAMVQAATARAAELGIENAEVRAMEAEWLDLPAGAVDAIVSRWGYMLLADPEAALREARRVLRSGGRIALAAWDAPDRNAWLTRAQKVLVEHARMEPPPADEPGPFAFGEGDRLEELLWGAGFADVRVAAVEFAFTAPSLDAWWDHITRTSPRMQSTLATLSPAEHYTVRDAFDAAYAEFVAPDGSVTIPARTLVASAEA